MPDASRLRGERCGGRVDIKSLVDAFPDVSIELRSKVWVRARRGYHTRPNADPAVAVRTRKHPMLRVRVDVPTPALGGREVLPVAASLRLGGHAYCMKFDGPGRTVRGSS